MLSLMPRGLPPARHVARIAWQVPSCWTRDTSDTSRPEPGSSAAGAARGPHARCLDPPPCQSPTPPQHATVCAAEGVGYVTRHALLSPKSKARIWPWLSYMRHIRSTADAAHGGVARSCRPVTEVRATRCRANVAHIRQSRPLSGLDSHAETLFLRQASGPLFARKRHGGWRFCSGPERRFRVGCAQLSENAGNISTQFF